MGLGRIPATGAALRAASLASDTKDALTTTAERAALRWAVGALAVARRVKALGAATANMVVGDGRGRGLRFRECAGSGALRHIP